MSGRDLAPKQGSTSSLGKSRRGSSGSEDPHPRHKGRRGSSGSADPHPHKTPIDFAAQNTRSLRIVGSSAVGGGDLQWAGINTGDKVAMKTNVVPEQSRLREELVMKLDSNGKWQKRYITMTRTQILILALRLPIHREGVIMRLPNDENEAPVPSINDMRYLVLSEGTLSLYISEIAYLQKQPPERTFDVLHSHVRAASEYSAHHAHMPGLAWTIEEVDHPHRTPQPPLHVACERRMDRSHWLSSVIKHKDDLTEGESLEAVDAIPMREITHVRLANENFFQVPIQEEEPGMIFMNYIYIFQLDGFLPSSAPPQKKLS
jgi:hypothetical protein